MTPKLHPLNQDFRWEPRGGPYRRISSAQARQWSEQGFFVLEDAVEPSTLERLIAEIDPWEAEREAWLRKQPQGRRFIARADEITFTVHLVKRSTFLRDFCAGPLFRDLAWDLVGPDVRLYWDQAVYKKPSVPAPFPWHQDNGYGFLEPQSYLTCWIALTDATTSNGCPRVLPGLHRHGTLEHWTTDLGYCCADEDAEGLAAPARAGSIVVFSSLTPHATGPNLTSEVRKAYIVQLAPDGAHRMEPDESAGGYRPVLQNDPDRQFPILAAGRSPET